eukprot:Lithocolla_globosa_v1_NODE_3786_length_1580_cov_16.880000.p2 type:complete len:122 gc:universal NODE_3786_length_1580_cov_16.880000:173-538(+)
MKEVGRTNNPNLSAEEYRQRSTQRRCFLTHVLNSVFFISNISLPQMIQNSIERVKHDEHFGSLTGLDENSTANYSSLENLQQRQEILVFPVFSHIFFGGLVGSPIRRKKLCLDSPLKKKKN